MRPMQGLAGCSAELGKGYRNTSGTLNKSCYSHLDESVNCEALERYQRATGAAVAAARVPRRPTDGSRRISRRGKGVNSFLTSESLRKNQLYKYPANKITRPCCL